MKLPAFSPSQIQTWQSCPRKWFFGSVQKRPRVQHPSALKGEKVHTILEGYLKTGILAAPETLDGAELAAIAESGICHLPNPAHYKIDLESSWSFERHTKAPLSLIVPTILYNGRKDLEYDAADGIWVVGDHKTTSNLRYALTKAQLATDPQAILYGAQAIQAQGRDKVRLTWIYYQTKRPYKSRLVEIVLDEDHVETELQKLDEIVGRKMLPLVGQKDLPPAEVEANLASCDKYGGCPYREICDVSPVARLRHVFTRFDVPENPLGIKKEEGTEMNILEKLKAAKAAAAAVNTTTQAAGPSVNPPESTPVNTEAKAPETVDIPVTSEVQPTPATEAPKPKRTRGPNKPKAEQADTEANPGYNAPTDMPARVIVLADCQLMGELRGAMVFTDACIYRDVHKAVNAELQVEDYALADFGKGAGAFSVLFAEALDKTVQEAQEANVECVVFLCDTRSREWAITSAAWRAKADSFVKGN